MYRARRYRYPNYSSSGSMYGSSYSGRSRYSYGSYNSSPYYNDYYYGYSRNRPNYWERDREISRRWRRERRRNGRRSPREDTPSPPRPPPKPEPPKEELVKQLHVKKVDFHTEQNTKKHRTDDYYDCKKSQPELVLRRGDSFKITITFDRPYSKAKNDMKLTFSIGERPNPSKGTRAVIEVDESGNKKSKPDEWGATLQSKDGNDVTIVITIPCNCIIGEWNFSVKTVSEGKDKDGKNKTLIFQYDHNEDITILFNPWCKDDGVYLEDQEKLAEYVLNDNGCVYRGNAWQPGAKEWNFGQFEKDILDICLQLLRTGFKGGVSKSMSDPIMVSRMIAKLVNLADDDKDKDEGVLIGNWSGDYKDGTSPLKWVGSPNILRQWRKSGPVKYGQCWVFSCVTTTVCRALGIPCRSVTNFSSAHDTDETNCIEKFFDDKGEPIEHWNNDSVWNFHVWNEVWMSRPDLKDLKTGFEYLRKPGWQVIDATPQEKSDGIFTCGPCPVMAVYKGYCDVNYDTGFVFAEVNSDEVHWSVSPARDFKVKEVFPKKVGKKISTKKPDGLPYKDETWGEGGMRFDRDAYDRKKHEDLTLTYKPKEGTQEERDTVKHALRTAKVKIMDYTKEPGEKQGNVEFHLHHDNNTMIGKDLKIQLSAKNNENQNVKMIFAKISVAPEDYTGGVGNAFFENNFPVDDAELKPGEEKIFTALLKHEDYLPKVVDQAHFAIIATAKYGVLGGDGNAYDVRKQHNFRFRRPDLDVTCPKTVRKGEKIQFEVSFKNPLDIPLTNCDISMDSAGIENIDDLKQNDVPANGEYRKNFSLTAERVKKQAAVTFSFDSDQLKDISGGNSIRITE